MRYEMLVGLKVIDEAMYEEYRNNMKPILDAHGGGFSNDFKISEVLLAEQPNEINRVFTIFFPNKKNNESVFFKRRILKSERAIF